MAKASITGIGALVAMAIMGGVLTGCGSESSASAPAASSLVGTWEGTAVGYSGGKLEEAVPLTVVITEADDASGTFAGERSTPAEEAARVNMNPEHVLDGVVSPWGEIAMVHDEGSFTLELEGDRLVGRYLEVGEDAAAKAITLTRQD